ncbi:unnamed protein product [Anisakis simplex]|uniref:Uncharacterized protein n=1 Tax=Anisakis simplex TaxID=6269 RepID=A0A0M3K6N6_ANISI|nr:unnamed protein product [Anisakis simplex]
MKDQKTKLAENETLIAQPIDHSEPIAKEYADAANVLTSPIANKSFSEPQLSWIPILDSLQIVPHPVKKHFCSAPLSPYGPTIRRLPPHSVCLLSICLSLFRRRRLTPLSLYRFWFIAI